MGLYLYCFLPGDAAPPPGLTGIDAAPVEARTWAGLCCWLSMLASVPRPSLERIRLHDAVVEAALGTGTTPLPARFGQWLPDEAALELALGPHRDAYLAALQRISGAVEFGVRVLDPAAEQALPELPASAPSGTAYLHQLAARTRAREALNARGREIAAELRAVLGTVVREERFETLPSPHGVVSVAHLVERSREAEYRAALEEVRRREPALRFLLTGPWPPYSFGA